MLLYWPWLVSIIRGLLHHLKSSGHLTIVTLQKDVVAQQTQVHQWLPVRLLHLHCLESQLTKCRDLPVVT